MRTLKGVAALAFVAVLAAACSGTASSPSAAASAAASPAESAAGSEAPSQAAVACSFASLATKTPGTLTIGADNPAYPPYYQPSDPATDPWELGDPTNRLGFEGRTAWTIARNLGFVGDTVTWVVAPFNNAIAPGPKDFDIYLTQVSYNAERAQAVDLSDGYYDVAQAVVAAKDSDALEGDHDRRVSRATSSAPRSARPASTRSTRSSPRDARRRSTTPTTSRSRRSRTARSTASSSTCRRRSS